MKTDLLRMLTQRRRCQHTGQLLTSFTLRHLFTLALCKRGAGGRAFEITWYPSEKLSCAYDVRTFLIPPTRRGSEKLLWLVGAVLTDRHRHYLADGEAAKFREVLTACHANH